MGNRHDVTASGGLILADNAKARIERNLDMSPEADKFLTSLANRTGLSEGDVIRVALGMLKTAVDAKEAGKHVGVASSPEALDIELVGF
jgi:hypothetical protein